MTAKKVGYYDLDPDVLNEILSKAASGSVTYNDKPLKNSIKILQNRLNELSENGASASFNKNADKVTMNMLTADLAATINKAIRVIDGSGEGQQAINENVTNRIETLQSQYMQEANDRAAVDGAHDLSITELENTLDDLEDIINAANESIDGMQTSSSSVMTGATALKDGTSGLVPAPKAGDESHVLLGNAKWVSQDDLVAGKALSDINDNRIITYLHDVTFDTANKKLIFTDGNGATKEVPLV